MEQQKYNGWSNRPTWLVALWLDNEEHIYRAVREPGADLTEAWLKDFVEDLLETDQFGGTLMGDIVSDFLADVHWEEIVQNVKAE